MNCKLQTAEQISYETRMLWKVYMKLRTGSEQDKT
jgi:hypothetical protein